MTIFWFSTSDSNCQFFHSCTTLFQDVAANDLHPAIGVDNSIDEILGLRDFLSAVDNQKDDIWHC